MQSGCIQTYSGLVLNLRNFRGFPFRIEDIAHGLSNTCRWSGQCYPYYSVAQHSVMVSRMCPPALRMHGLLHDAAEAFLGDLAGPVKSLLPDYKGLESALQREIYICFGLNPQDSEGVKEFDRIAEVSEALELLPIKPDWALSSPLERREIHPLTGFAAKELFLSRFTHLGGKAR